MKPERKLNLGFSGEAGVEPQRRQGAVSSRSSGSRAREEHPVEPAGIGGWKRSKEFRQQKFRSVRRRWGGAAAQAGSRHLGKLRLSAPAWAAVLILLALLRLFLIEKDRPPHIKIKQAACFKGRLYMFVLSASAAGCKNLSRLPGKSQ